MIKELWFILQKRPDKAVVPSIARLKSPWDRWMVQEPGVQISAEEGSRTLSSHVWLKGFSLSYSLPLAIENEGFIQSSLAMRYVHDLGDMG